MWSRCWGFEQHFGQMANCPQSQPIQINGVFFSSQNHSFRMPCSFWLPCVVYHRKSEFPSHFDQPRSIWASPVFTYIFYGCFLHPRTNTYGIVLPFLERQWSMGNCYFRNAPLNVTPAARPFPTSLWDPKYVGLEPPKASNSNVLI